MNFFFDAIFILYKFRNQLGLSVLVSRPANKSTFGGKGVTITEVLNFLRATSPRMNYYRTNLSFGSGFSPNNSNLGKLKDKGTWVYEKDAATVIASTPLINGHALGVAFLGKSSTQMSAHRHMQSVRNRMLNKQW